jgi:hypothetical protein
MTGPEQEWLPFFNRTEEPRNPSEVPHDAPEPENEKPRNPHVGRGDGLLGQEAYEQALQHMRTLRADKPLLSDEKIIGSAISLGELRGRKWVTALKWAISHGEVPAKKEITPTIKVIPGQKSLRRYGGNRHIDDAANNNK